ncbi:unnamed protein product [Brachionus calyciflorus]|uniref:Uncharacterized protein n=1 Tax=Brachionus calyciflorus TaxID=104777 RepID=A0A813W4G4_9BILA|nr:unnamed protein product [Brachionus calyciflorus]
MTKRRNQRRGISKCKRLEKLFQANVLLANNIDVLTKQLVLLKKIVIDISPNGILPNHIKALYDKIDQ